MNEFTTVKSIERFVRSSKITITVIVDYMWTLRGRNENDSDYKKILSEIHIRSANRILDGCLKNGGIYIKIGQGVAAINNVLPDEYTTTLSLLHDKCLTRKPNEVRTIFLEEFGKTPEEMFKHFDYVPIAAASLAQVFKAITKNDEKIAVKVQYIDLQKRFKADVHTILFLQDCVGILFKEYNFGWIFKGLRDNLYQELDFINEGHNLEKCANDLKIFSYAYVPKIYWEFSTNRILTAEYIDGYKITDIDSLKNNNFDIADIDKKLFTIFAEQIFNTGFVHGDPHPGNIFVRRNKYGKTELVLLDHGLYETINFDIRQNLCHFWKAIILKDLKEMEKYSSALNVSDSIIFAEMLLQRPFDMSLKKISTKLTEEDFDYLVNVALKRFDLIMKTLREMPKTLLFILRNLNIVRAIAKDHGDPIDRPKVMARYAVNCIKKNKTNSGIFSWLKQRIYFEFKLWIQTTKYQLFTFYMELLTKLGRAPDTKKLLNIEMKV